MLNDYALNFYLNGMLIGASEIVATIICIPIIAIWPRKYAMGLISLVAGIISTPLFIWFSCIDECNST